MDPVATLIRLEDADLHGRLLGPTPPEKFSDDAIVARLRVYRELAREPLPSLGAWRPAIAATRDPAGPAVAACFPTAAAPAAGRLFVVPDETGFFAVLPALLKDEGERVVYAGVMHLWSGLPLEDWRPDARWTVLDLDSSYPARSQFKLVEFPDAGRLLPCFEGRPQPSPPRVATFHRELWSNLGGYAAKLLGLKGPEIVDRLAAQLAGIEPPSEDVPEVSCVVSVPGPRGDRFRRLRISVAAFGEAIERASRTSGLREELQAGTGSTLVVSRFAPWLARALKADVRFVEPDPARFLSMWQALHAQAIPAYLKPLDEVQFVVKGRSGERRSLKVSEPRPVPEDKQIEILALTPSGSHVFTLTKGLARLQVEINGEPAKLEGEPMIYEVLGDSAEDVAVRLVFSLRVGRSFDVCVLHEATRRPLDTKARRASELIAAVFVLPATVHTANRMEWREQAVRELQAADTVQRLAALDANLASYWSGSQDLDDPRVLAHAFRRVAEASKGLESIRESHKAALRALQRKARDPLFRFTPDRADGPPDLQATVASCGGLGALVVGLRALVPAAASDTSRQEVIVSTYFRLGATLFGASGWIGLGWVDLAPLVGTFSEGRDRSLRLCGRVLVRADDQLAFLHYVHGVLTSPAEQPHIKDAALWALARLLAWHVDHEALAERFDPRPLLLAVVDLAKSLAPVYRKQQERESPETQVVREAFLSLLGLTTFGDYRSDFLRKADAKETLALKELVQPAFYGGVRVRYQQNKTATHAAHRRTDDLSVLLAAIVNNQGSDDRLFEALFEVDG